MTHRIILPVFAATLSFAATGCMTTQQIVSDDGFAKIGEPTRACSLIVRPTKVVEDSRCPINARCVWAGRLIVRASVTYGDTRETHDLTLGEPFRIAGGSLTLDGAEPGKVAGQDQPPPDYRLHFSFAD